MLPLRLCCSHSGASTGTCVESILARSWYMGYGPLSHTYELVWLSLILSDGNKVRTALLHTEYCHHRSQIMDDDAALAALEQQYYKLQCFVTPIHRLPVEILREIFYIALNRGEPRTGLTHVCQHWHKIIEGMSNAWTSLKLRAWTAPEGVQQLLSRAGRQPLIVEIDIEETGSMVGGLNSPLALAAASASQWETFTITSLPQLDQNAHEVQSLPLMRLQPMEQLRHFKVMQAVPSPLLSQLLQNIATAAVESLASMEVHSPLVIEYLLQPSRVSIFSSLTIFKAIFPKTNGSVDLLPHFNQLKVLELTNLLLPLYGPEPLPIVDTLRCLHLKAASIQWMEGQVFPRLESCTIITPPIRDLHPVLDVTLPTCTTFEISNKDIFLIRKFQVPNVGSLVVKTNQWSTVRGHGQIAPLFRVVFETPLNLHALHLAIPCEEKVLLAMLRLLPGLEELKLDLPRPAALGKLFFTALLAKPIGQFNWIQSNELKKGEGRRVTLCPQLRVLGLKYQQWLRQSDSLEFFAPLFAMCWSRTATPMKLDIHFKSSQNSWKVFALSHKSTVAISTLEIPSLIHSDQRLSFHLLEQCFPSVTCLPVVIKTLNTIFCATPLFTLCCYHLQVLKLDGHGDILKIDALLSLQHLRELTLKNIFIPSLSSAAYLPLVHTLRKLSLFMSDLSWMDGRVFALLKRFEVDEESLPQSFKDGVAMPACTHLIFRHYILERLSLLQSNFQFPILDMWEFASPWEDPPPDQQEISALQIIQAKALYFDIWGGYERLLDLLESKEEVEQLELRFGSFPHLQMVLTRLSVVNEDTNKMPCPNMKVLGLHRPELLGNEREQVIQWCIQMMEKRILAGYRMDKCSIWWKTAKEEPPSLVLNAE